MRVFKIDIEIDNNVVYSENAWESGLSNRLIQIRATAKLMGGSKWAVFYHRPSKVNYRIKHKIAVIDQILRMRDDNMTYELIGKRLGLSAQTIKNRIADYKRKLINQDKS